MKKIKKQLSLDWSLTKNRLPTIFWQQSSLKRIRFFVMVLLFDAWPPECNALKRSFAVEISLYCNIVPHICLISVSYLSLRCKIAPHICLIFINLSPLSLTISAINITVLNTFSHSNDQNRQLLECYYDTRHR